MTDDGKPEANAVLCLEAAIAKLSLLSTTSFTRTEVVESLRQPQNWLITHAHKAYRCVGVKVDSSF